MRSDSASRNLPVEPVFVDCLYRYRRLVVLAFAVMFGSMGLFMLWHLLGSNLRGEVESGNWPMVLFAIVITLVFLLPAPFLMWLFLFRPVVAIRIDAAGIRFDREFWEWSNVTYVGLSPRATLRHRASMLEFHVRTRWRWSRVRDLPVELDDQQCDDMLDRLDKYLHEKHPHVVVG